jgi:hypothetical protein
MIYKIHINKSWDPLPLLGLESYLAHCDGEGYHIPPIKLSITLENSFLLLLIFLFFLFVFLLNKALMEFLTTLCRGFNHASIHSKISSITRLRGTRVPFFVFQEGLDS